MSKQTASKRSITAWLKKENLPMDEEDTTDEIEPKLFKQSLRICLEPIDKNILNRAEVTDPVVIKEIPSVKEKVQEDKNVKVQSIGIRRSARNLPPGEKPVVDRGSLIEHLPPIIFKGHINYVRSFHDCAKVCDDLLIQVENSKDKCVPVGFDLEWPFSFQTGSGRTALAQICLTEDVCYLIHLYKFQKLPASFIALLSHSKVKLVGINIKNDIWKLTRDFKEFPGQKVVDNNCLDCGPYANRVFSRSGRWSLERLTAYLLKQRINKDPSVRRSKWHIYPLSQAQKLYAATDAYVSLLLHLTIEQREALAEAEEALQQESQN